MKKVQFGLLAAAALLAVSPLTGVLASGTVQAAAAPPIETPGSETKPEKPTTGILTLVDLSDGTTINAHKQAWTIYQDPKMTRDSGKKLSTDQEIWTPTQVARDSNGVAVSYNLGDNQWIGASNVTVIKGTPDTDLTVAKYTSSDPLYSIGSDVTVYSDPDTTKASGTLAAGVSEWQVNRTATDPKTGTVVAYDLGKNQWVKAKDLSAQKALTGTFIVNAGTPLLADNGSQVGTISASGSYQVTAVSYFDGHQVLKLAENNQWVQAAKGAFYPA
ncbi:MAG: hypothetical protein LKF36_10500 [Lactobacillus sp.]|jgi:hypothetical protein|nr:hypothetical protein [Lactobacillus sp.]